MAITPYNASALSQDPNFFLPSALYDPTLLNFNAFYYPQPTQPTASFIHMQPRTKLEPRKRAAAARRAAESGPPPGTRIKTLPDGNRVSVTGPLPPTQRFRGKAPISGTFGSGTSAMPADESGITPPNDYSDITATPEQVANLDAMRARRRLLDRESAEQAKATRLRREREAQERLAVGERARDRERTRPGREAALSMRALYGASPALAQGTLAARSALPGSTVQSLSPLVRGITEGAADASAAASRRYGENIARIYAEEAARLADIEAMRNILSPSSPENRAVAAAADRVRAAESAMARGRMEDADREIASLQARPTGMMGNLGTAIPSIMYKLYKSR